MLSNADSVELFSNFDTVSDYILNHIQTGFGTSGTILKYYFNGVFFNSSIPDNASMSLIEREIMKSQSPVVPL